MSMGVSRGSPILHGRVTGCVKPWRLRGDKLDGKSDKKEEHQEVVWSHPSLTGGDTPNLTPSPAPILDSLHTKPITRKLALMTWQTHVDLNPAPPPPVLRLNIARVLGV